MVTHRRTTLRLRSRAHLAGGRASRGRAGGFICCRPLPFDADDPTLFSSRVGIHATATGSTVAPPATAPAPPRSHPFAVSPFRSRASRRRRVHAVRSVAVPTTPRSPGEPSPDRSTPPTSPESRRVEHAGGTLVSPSSTATVRPQNGGLLGRPQTTVSALDRRRHDVSERDRDRDVRERDTARHAPCRADGSVAATSLGTTSPWGWRVLPVAHPGTRDVTCRSRPPGPRRSSRRSRARPPPRPGSS